jgi:coenzyme PQQ precursor peptide PqqA
MRAHYAGRGIRGTSAVAAHSRPLTSSRTLHMKWETPTAVDFRFGMEITMYVSNR